jgi:predicted CXXCH cytochrome family protein
MGRKQPGDGSDGQRAAAALLGIALGVTACASAAARPLFVRYPEVEAAHVKNIHLYQGRPLCQACHEDGLPRLLAGPVGTCLRCHQVSHTPGHETGRLLERTEKVGLPLPDGRVVCHTCHDPHDLAREPSGLRLPSKALCLECHRGY